MGKRPGRLINIFPEIGSQEAKILCVWRILLLSPGVVWANIDCWFWEDRAIFGWVDYVFLRCWSRKPSKVMYDLGMCRLTVATDSPSQVAKKPWWIVLSQVERKGYPAAACRKATRSCAILTDRVLIARLDMWGCFILGAGMGTVHILFLVRGPLAMSWLLYRMFMSYFLNVATYPESHNCPIDRNDPVFKDGNRCDWRAARGRPVIGMMPVLVDLMQLLSGSCTWMGLVSVWMLSHGLLVLKKFRCVLCRIFHVE